MCYAVTHYAPTSSDCSPFDATWIQPQSSMPSATNLWSNGAAGKWKEGGRGPGGGSGIDGQGRGQRLVHQEGGSEWKGVWRKGG